MHPHNSYLVPHSLSATTADETPVLQALVQQLMASHRSATSSANILLTYPSQHRPHLKTLFKDRALTMAHAKVYTTGWGFGVAYCAFMSLANVCKSVLSLCQDRLLPLAQILDKDGAGLLPTHTQVLGEFRMHITSLKAACCTANPNAGNLLWTVQTLMPSLSKLSGQIDNDAQGKQDTISQVSSVDALPHWAMLAQIKNFNLRVNEVLTIAQSILNVMSEWQDRLDLLIEMSPNPASQDGYKEHVNAAILYWQTIQNTLTEHLQLKHEKPKANHFAQPAKAWRPRFTPSQSRA